MLGLAVQNKIGAFGLEAWDKYLNIQLSDYLYIEVYAKGSDEFLHSLTVRSGYTLMEEIGDHYISFYFCEYTASVTIRDKQDNKIAEVHLNNDL